MSVMFPHDPPGGHFSREIAAFCEELLAADERGREAGNPLLTAAGLRYFLRISVAAKRTLAAAAQSDQGAADRGRSSAGK